MAVGSSPTCCCSSGGGGGQSEFAQAGGRYSSRVLAPHCCRICKNVRRKTQPTLFERRSSDAPRSE